MKTFNLSSSIPSAYLSFSFLAAIFLFSQEIFAQDKTIPGEVTTPYPTLINLAVEWIIQGEDNQNGIVNIQFREKGNKKWEQGMPLRRVPAGENVGFKCVNKHSGSIIDLKPDTEYEIKLNLEDPDGGSAEKTVVTRTRSVPVIGKNAEIIEIQPGKYDTLLTKNCTAEKPIVYRCSKGEAIYKYIDLRNRKWVFIEGLTIINPAPHGKGISLNGAANCVVRRCSIDAVYGIIAYKPGATNCYFSDNVITGTCEWTNEAMGANGKNIGEGIEITGPGNVML